MRYSVEGEERRFLKVIAISQAIGIPKRVFPKKMDSWGNAKSNKNKKRRKGK